MVLFPAERRTARTTSTLTPHRCECGIRLDWQASACCLGRITWIATCPHCGQTYQSASEADTTVRTFLLAGQEPQPYAPPWVRLFLAVERIPNSKGWKPAGKSCWLCQQTDLTFRFLLRPAIFRVDAVDLCLDCGAVETVEMGDEGHVRRRGSDWTNITGPVRSFREAIRQRRTFAENWERLSQEEQPND